MDAFHIGHQEYLEYAHQLAEKVTIYINHELFVQPSKTYDVLPWNVRVAQVRAHLHGKDLLSKTTILPAMSLRDIEALFRWPDVDAVVVAQDRVGLPERLNAYRRSPFVIVVKPRLLSENGEDISSTSINLHK